MIFLLSIKMQLGRRNHQIRAAIFAFLVYPFMSPSTSNQRHSSKTNLLWRVINFFDSPPVFMLK